MIFSTRTSLKAQRKFFTVGYIDLAIVDELCAGIPTGKMNRVRNHRSNISGNVKKYHEIFAAYFPRFLRKFA